MEANSCTGPKTYPARPHDVIIFLQVYHGAQGFSMVFTCFLWFSKFSGSPRTHQAPKIQDQLDSSGSTLHVVREPIPLCPCFPFWRLAKMIPKKKVVWWGPCFSPKWGTGGTTRRTKPYIALSKVEANSYGNHWKSI